MPHRATIHPHKQNRQIGDPFVELESVDSTNNYAMAQVHAGLAFHGMVFFAHEQFAGKGQRGKVWAATTGENIMMSIVLQPFFLTTDHQFALSATIALACYDFLDTYCPGDITIKWPNDLYWRDRKAGGILIETVLQGSGWSYAICGIGININQTEFSSQLINPVSLHMATGKKYEPVAMAKELCRHLENRYNRLRNLDNVWLDNYNSVLYKKNQTVHLKHGSVYLKACINGVNSKGQLHTGGDQVRVFNFGEIEWMIKSS